MSRWLSIVGIGEDGLAGLSGAARTLVDTAEVVVGGARHLAMLPEDGRERLTWPSPLSLLVDEIERRRGQRVCVLATGDPMWFGIGVTLARRIPAGEMTIVPVPSAFSLACARLGWSLAEAETLTLHGRQLILILPHLYPGARILALSDGGETPAALAALLTARGFGESRMTVLAHMGGPKEQCFEGRASDWPHAQIPDLNTVALECVAGPQAQFHSRTAGLPDDAFEHDGQLTKREVRAVTLSALAPLPGETLWDVGAGNGSVAIEWLRHDRRLKAWAIERDVARRDRIARNAVTLGVPDLNIVAGTAPGALNDLPEPDAIFVGGGTSDGTIIEACWQALRAGGRMVANAVTLEGEAALQDWQQRLGGDLVRLQVSRMTPVGPYRSWRPAMSVTQWTIRRS